MKFKRVFRGYDVKQVDAYILHVQEDEKQHSQALKERIDELTEENYVLLKQVEQYQTDEKAISKSLIDSQKLADELTQDAEKYSDLVLTRAKIFYAAWSAYSQTLIATLSDDEVKSFNKIQGKIENIINAYEGKNIADDSKDLVQMANSQEDVAMTEQLDITPSEATMQQRLQNPIDKVQQASDYTIDLRELASTDQSLEQLCADLGLTGGKL
mgnify:CR=1 FL=1